MGTPIDARTARDIAREEVENHEDICAERYATLRNAIGELKAGQERISGWISKAAILVFGSMGGLICWLLVELYKTKLG